MVFQLCQNTKHNKVVYNKIIIFHLYHFFNTHCCCYCSGSFLYRGHKRAPKLPSVHVPSVEALESVSDLDQNVENVSDPNRR